MTREMTRRRFLRAVGLGVAALEASGFVRAQDAAAGDKPPAVSGLPHIVLINADDLGYGDVGCYGARKVQTPNIDRLAREGRMFMDAHAASAVCTPSRYCLLTGQYAWRISNWKPIFLRDGLIIDTRKMTVARLLKEHGYATACIGKWHLGFGEKSPDWNGELKPGPLEVGFDYYFGVPIVNSHPPFVYVENHRVVGLDPADPFVMKGTSPSKPYPEKFLNKGISGAKAAHDLYKDEEVATTLTQKAVEWIRGHREGRFFLYLATTNIHHPFTPHPRFKGTSGCGLYGDFIHELDWVVAQVLQTLDELNLAKDTLVVFTSDNGGMLNGGGKKAWTAGHRLNGNLLGFKFGAWEGGHRVPFIVRWPGRVPVETRSDQLISNIDILATLSAIVGYTLKDADAPDSFNVLPAWTGNPDKPIRDHLIQASVTSGHIALRTGRWVYITQQGSGGFGNGLKEVAFTGEVNSDVTPDGKIRKDAPPAQLYDLQADLSEAKNVFREHPEVVNEMKSRLEKYKTDGRTRPVAT